MRGARATASCSLAIVAVAIGVAACVSSAQRLQRFVGRPVAELVAERGPAHRIVAYPYGGHLYVWETEAIGGTAADATTRRGLTTATGARVVREIALVNDSGIVVETRVESGDVSAKRPGAS
jgi:hypothetical protein